MSVLASRNTPPLCRPSGSRDTAPLAISDLAWDMLWNVEEADAVSMGCADHGLPDCLCDVDVSLTADIEWERGPMELVYVETLDDLLVAATEMLSRLRLNEALREHRYIRSRELVGGRKTYDHTEETLENLALSGHLEELVRYLIEHPREGGTAVQQATGIDIARNTIEYLRKVLGLGPAKYTVANYLPLLRRWAEAGHTPAEIRSMLKENTPLSPSYDTVYQLLQRHGLVNKRAA